MLKGFKDFVMRGNVVDLAVAVAIGAAFVALIAAFGEFIINPLLATLGGSGGTGFGFNILSSNDKTFINIGGLINAVIIFVATAAIIYFLIVVPMNAVKARRKSGQEAGPAEPTDVELLIEIRNLLAQQQSGGKSL